MGQARKDSGEEAAGNRRAARTPKGAAASAPAGGGRKAPARGSTKAPAKGSAKGSAGKPPAQAPQKQPGKVAGKGAARGARPQPRDVPGELLPEPGGSPPRPDEMDEEVVAFITAIEEYKRLRRRPFPNWSEILEVVKSLGYVRAR